MSTKHSTFPIAIIQITITTVDQKRKQSAQTSFPLICAIASSFGQVLFEATVRLVLVAILVLIAEVKLTLTALLAPIFLLSAVPLFFGLGLLLSVFNLIYKDVSRVVTILLRYGIFVSGVIFPVATIPVLAHFNYYNPFALVIDSIRSAVLISEVLLPIFGMNELLV